MLTSTVTDHRFVVLRNVRRKAEDVRALAAPAVQRARLIDNAILLWSYRRSLRYEARQRVEAVLHRNLYDYVSDYRGWLRQFRQTLIYPAIVMIGIPLLLAVPVSIGGFDDKSANWRLLLLNFWLVAASVVGLATAVTVFVFQIFATRSTGQYGTLLEFAYDTFLLDLVIFGVAGLITAPLSLYATANANVGGWDALVVALSLAIPIALLPFVFRLALRAIEPSELESRRRKRLLDSARAHVDRVAVERAALVLLQGWAAGRNVQINPWIRQIGEDEELIVARKPGRVADIDLNALERLRSAVTSYAPGRQVRLLVQLGHGVTANRQLLVYPTPPEETTRQIARAVVSIHA